MARVIAGADAPWKDKHTLHQKRVEESKTYDEIGDELGCTGPNVRYWCVKFGVGEFRANDTVPKFRTDVNQGYEYVGSSGSHFVAVHQLLAIAEGADPHIVFGGMDYHVHHENHIPWDNRPENIEVISAKEHQARHHLGATR